MKAVDARYKRALAAVQGAVKRRMRAQGLKALTEHDWNEMCRVFERQFGLDDDPDKAYVLGLRADMEQERRRAAQSAERAARLKRFALVGVKYAAVALVIGIGGSLARNAVVADQRIAVQLTAVLQRKADVYRALVQEDERRRKDDLNACSTRSEPDTCYSARSQASEIELEHQQTLFELERALAAQRDKPPVLVMLLMILIPAIFLTPLLYPLLYFVALSLREALLALRQIGRWPLRVTHKDGRALRAR